MSLLSKPQLPPEIWNQTLAYIPTAHQANLLGVSRLFHDIIVRFLFSAIKIYFVGGDTGLEYMNDFFYETNDTEEVTPRLSHRSWEILHHITQEPRFARIVRSITIISYMDGEAIFEKLTLAAALRALSNLQVFRWMGVLPGFTDNIASCISPSVHTLVIQSYISPSNIRHLTNVRRLQLPFPFFYPDDLEVLDSSVEDSILEGYSSTVSVERILEVVSPGLQSLGILAMHIGQVPIRVYDSLTQLDIFASEYTDIDGLEFVLRHATRLESLSLVGKLKDGTFSVLPKDSEVLPHLHSFRVSAENHRSFEELGVSVWRLYCFLQGRKSLRRLYVRLCGATWDSISTMLPTIISITGLEVLGLYVGYDPLEPAVIRTLANVLSTRLRALHLAIAWVPRIDLSLSPLLERISELPHLTFLHLYGTLGRLQLLPWELASENQKLITVGLNRALWDINRSGAEITTTKWPRWKVKYCTDDEFVCEDDAWLFKYN